MSVRVRIAPSPTGDPHVGTAYIGLINYAFARRYGGRFVLRIEDTDQARCTQASAQAIFDSLKWLGLRYDEGPDVGGDRGPYVQSQRHAQGIYRRYAERLVEQGDAYYCFCTSADLDEMRKRQLAAKQPVMYDRRHREADVGEAKERIARGEPHVIRIKAPLAGEHAYKDRLRPKPVVKPWADIDDQVLIKADGWPTYHLAAVVDDHLMGITHVIRAEEWLNSLPKHILLNEKLGFAPPEYVHVGLLRNADKSKISKRKNPTSLLWYQQQGYLPEALVNFLAQMVHGHPAGAETFSLEQFVEVFDLDRMNVTGPVFDMAKLRHLQGQWFRELPAWRIRAEIHRAIDTRFDALLPLLRERVTFPGDWLHHAAPFQVEAVDPRAEDLLPKGLTKEQVRPVVEALQKTLRDHFAEGRPWDAAAIEELLKQQIAANAGTPEAPGSPAWQQKHVYAVLRVAATGRAATPPLFETIAQIGAIRLIERLGTAAARLR